MRSKKKSSKVTRPAEWPGKAAVGQPALRTPGPKPRRRWWFSLAALGLPFLVLALLEIGLRGFGYGYPTAYFLKSRVAGKPVFIENQEFTKRFFPPGLARTPEPVVVPAVKPPDTRRIFVFGESAAMGDPEPAYGAGRILEVLLRARYPGKKWEIVNVAITAINSHVVREIAQDCAALNGDVWVVYMGNNEVVGPFGAGTVFGAQTPSLAFIRATLALKATRVGQWLDAWQHRLSRRSETPARWEGMEMFLRQQIRPEDPRLAKVYLNFQRNLEDIVRIGARAGARVLVSTLASNLKDCPPFGSLHRPGLAAAQLSAWESFCKTGGVQEAATNHAAALAAYQEAARLDDHYAELCFRMARCQWALGQYPEAAKNFERAQDFDTLRFRSDTRLNEIVRQVASRRSGPGFKLVDVREIVSKESPHGVTGEEWLWEHVHFNFAGNYLVARTWAEQVGELWPAKVDGSSSPRSPWLSADECARRLALTDWDRFRVLDELSERLRQPPFSSQLDHESRDRRWSQRRGALQPALAPEALPGAAEIYRQALALAPDDWMLHEHFAKLLEAFGELPQAELHWRRSLERMPHREQACYGLANNLHSRGKNTEAIGYFREALSRRPGLYEARNGLGLALASSGQPAEAIEQFRAALRSKPDFAEARVNLGQALVQQGKITEARAEYQAALAANSNSVAARINLGKLLASQSQWTEAIGHYREAIRLKPDSAIAHYNLGNALSGLGDAEALPHYAEAARLRPEFAEARFNLGLGLARQGKPAEALAQFQQVVQLRPDFAEGHLNLGVVLAKAGRLEEAAEQFRETLRLEPGHARARKFLEEALRGPRR